MTDNVDLSALRRDYESDPFDEKHVNADPVLQFKSWFDVILASDVQDPNAVFLATAGKNAKPSVRTVLIKEYSSEGFVFFTNYQSRKGRELAENPAASLLFYWDFINRQVRIEGNVRKISAEESDAYFYSRPRESQVGAIASNQSEVIPDRSFLEDKVEEISKREEIRRPRNWGGYILEPDYFEFWQGQISRLHDRLAYTRNAKGKWSVTRLSP